MDKRDLKLLNFLNKDIQSTLKVNKPNNWEVASYGPVLKNKKTNKFFYYQHKNDACHAGLGSLYSHPRMVDIEDFDLVSVASAIKFGMEDKSCYLFLEWLLNFSPYRDIWVNNNPKTVMNNRYLLAKSDAPTNVLVGGMFASRAIWEHQARIAKIWEAFVRRGCNPSLAFLMGHIYRVDNKKGDNCSATYNPIDWHVAVSGYSSEVTAYQLNFIKGVAKPDKTFKSSFDEKSHYRNIHGTWSSGNADRRLVDFSSIILQIEHKGREEDYKNPFEKAKINADGAKSTTLGALAEYLTPILNEKVKV